MPKYITEENNDALLAAGMTNFLDQVEKNEVVLGIDADELNAMNSAFNAFKDDFDAQTAAKAELKAATTSKNSSKKAAKRIIAQFAQEWKANLAVPDNVLDLLNVPNHASGGVRTPPTQPLNLRLTIGSTGENTLAWDRNGNNSSTIFNIESASSANGPWTTFDMTTKAKINFSWPQGTTIWFRVNAKRNGQTSPNSQPIALWASTSLSKLKVA
jgi:hypothetical protein